MDQYGLTAKQLKLFKFIKNYIAKKNISPSYEEMKMAVGLKSKNSINKRVSQLEDRKWIKRLPGKARSIQIIKQ
jgi:repressor LexA|tara:strand:- start:818 stop:1039 length:222 start_codon:yes stop_codon:yes gene_type:complete